MAKNPSHKDHLTALKRVEGQIRGIARMVEQEKYCIDIITQIMAVKGAINRVEEKIIEKHFQSCVIDAMRGKSEKDKKQKLDEILALLHQARKG